MNALDTALVELAAASTALERTSRPNLKDVEEARDKAKKAHGILDAAHKLLSCGIYSVADAPAAPGPALFTPKGAPAVVPAESLPTLGYIEAEVVEAEPKAVPAPAGWDDETEEDQEREFLALLGNLEDACVTEGLTLKAAKACRVEWAAFYAATPREAWLALWAAFYGRPEASMAIPDPDDVEELLAVAGEGGGE